MKKLLALLLALVMLFSITACGGSGSDAKPAEAEGEEAEAPAPAAPAVEATEPEELGSGTAKWSEMTTADGWIMVTQEGGDTLGYSPDSGVSLIQADGFAFKDMNKTARSTPTRTGV